MCVAQVGIIEPQAEARGFGETSGRNPPRRKEAIEKDPMLRYCDEDEDEDEGED